jgi:hypothetical protein
VLRRIRRLPSPALVISAIALIVAVGGGTFAIASLSKPKVKKIAKSVANKQIKRQAPALSVDHAKTAGSAASATHATSADNATNATNAASVGGQSITKINYSAAPGPGSQTIFNSGGLTITATCSPPFTDIALTATTTKNGSSIYTFVGGDGSPTAANPSEADLENGLFTPSDNFDLLAGGNGNVNFVHFEYNAPDGTVATGYIVTDEIGLSACHATGDVISG